MNFSFDGLGYQDIYQLQLALENAIPHWDHTPQCVLDLHASIIHFWAEVEVASLQAEPLEV